MNGEQDKILHEVTGSEYKCGFCNPNHFRNYPSRAQRGGGEDDFVQKRRTRLDAGVSLKSISPLANHGNAHMGSFNNTPIDYQDIIFYAAPRKRNASTGGGGEIDPELKATFDKAFPLRSNKCFQELLLMQLWTALR